MDPRRTAIPWTSLFVARREISHGIRGANAKVLKFDRGRRSMHTVMWTYKLPTGTPKGQLIETINATAHNYEGIPG
jgi:hypothetical protein